MNKYKVRTHHNEHTIEAEQMEMNHHACLYLFNIDSEGKPKIVAIFNKDCWVNVYLIESEREMKLYKDDECFGL